MPYFIYRFTHPESANIFAFLQFMEDREKVDLDQWHTKSASLPSKAKKKRQKIKMMYRKKFRKRQVKQKELYRKMYSMLERSHDKSIRRQYLMGSPDESFTMEEWKKMHP